MTIKDIWLIVHFIGLFIGLGSGFVFLLLNKVSANMPPADKGKFMQTISILAYTGPLGLVILIISGIGLTIPAWDAYKQIGTFHAKMTIAGIMFILAGVSHMLRKKYAGGPPPKALKMLGPIAFTLGFTNVILAVISFH